jgi:hypothetical protein
MRIRLRCSGHRALATRGASTRQDSDKTRTRLGQDSDKTRTRLRQDSDKTRARLGQDSDKTQTRLGQDSDKTRIRLGQDSDKTRTILRQDSDKTRARLGQDSDKTRTRLGQDSDKTRTRSTRSRRGPPSTDDVRAVGSGKLGAVGLVLQLLHRGRGTETEKVGGGGGGPGEVGRRPQPVAAANSPAALVCAAVWRTERRPPRRGSNHMLPQDDAPTGAL